MLGLHNLRNRRRGEKGFSLLEASVGMLMLGAVLVSMYGALTWAWYVVGFSRDNLRATQIMIEKMEICRLYSWDQITDPTFFPKHFEIAGTPTYKGKMKVSAGPGDVDYKQDMKKVTIEISWETGGMKREREFVTYVTKNGLQSYYF